MRRWFVSCVVLFFAGVLPVGAQIPTGKIEGKVVEGLPVGRTLDAATLLAPGVTNTGPNGNITISGAMSYENWCW